MSKGGGGGAALWEMKMKVGHDVNRANWDKVQARMFLIPASLMNPCKFSLRHISPMNPNLLNSL